MSIEFEKTGIVNSCNIADSFSSFAIRDFSAKYDALEYLQSTGTQYINTGYAALGNNIDISITFDPVLTGYPKYFVLFGSQNASYSQWIYFYSYEIGTMTQAWFYLGTSASVANFSLSAVKQTISLKLRDGAYTALLDNQYRSGTYSGTVVSGSNLYLFGGSVGDTLCSSERYIGKIYSASIKANNVFTRYFVPAQRKSDSVLGMYDLVNGAFYTNAGSGAFTAGPVISNTNIIQCSDIIEN